MTDFPFLQFLNKPKNELEKGGRTPVLHEFDEVEATKQCPACGLRTPISVLVGEDFSTCSCGYHFRMNARERLNAFADKDSFSELYREVVSRDVLEFPGYTKKLENVRKACSEPEAVVCGTCSVESEKCAIFIMEPYFMMGSMGTAVGEKITRLFEYATQHKLPVVGFTVSGGARMQEGILSLMQMAKTTGAVRRHSENGGFYLTVLTDPTTGGVTASFAMLGDIILAEPGATVGFAGSRVIEQTVHKKLPEGFQKAEFLIEHGFVDAVVARKQQRKVISQLLKIHRQEGQQ